MIVRLKSPAVLWIGLAAFVCFGPRNDSDSVEAAEKASSIAPGCGGPSARCMVDIRYTYPAADLLVSADDVNF